MNSPNTSTTADHFRALPSLLAEAAWLTAAAMVPLSLDLQAGEMFHTPKVVLSQILGLISLGSIIWAWCGGTKFCPLGAKGANIPLGPVVALILLATVSGFFSIDPTRSAFTSPVTSYGAFSLATYASLLAAMVVFLRSSEQMERLVAAMVSSSLPVALLAISQRYGVSPQGLGTDIVTSTAGHPIFLAGYLLMIIPLTLRQLYLAWTDRPRRLTPIAAVYAGILLAQFAAFLACEKRGPLLSAAASVCLALVLWAAITHKTKLLKAALVFGAASVLLLLTLALLRGWGLDMGGIWIVDRLSRILPVDGAEGAEPFRSGLWNSAAPLWMSTEAVLNPDGSRDGWHWLRFWIGYGPDTVRAVLPTTWIWIFSWPNQALDSSCHSLFWDFALTMGLVGVAVLFWIFFELLYACAGLMQIAPPGKTRLLTLSAVGALLGSIPMVAIFGLGFAGVGLQAGFAVSFFVQICYSALRCGKPIEMNGTVLLGMAFAIALTAHWIDMAFVFQTGNTAQIFWILAGASCAANCVLRPNGYESKKHYGDAAQHWPLLVSGGLGVALLHGAADIPPVILGKLPLTQLWGPPHFLIALVTTLGLSIYATAILLPVKNRERVTVVSQTVIPVIAILLLYAAGMLWFVRVLATTYGNDWILLAEIWAAHYPALVVLGIAVFCLSSYQQGAWNTCASVCAGGVLTAAIVFTATWLQPLQTSLGDMCRGFAARMPQKAYPLLDRALAFRPEDFEARALYVWLLTEIKVPRHNRNEAPSAAAERILLQGMELSHRNVQSATLGRLYLRNAARAEGTERMRWAAKAREALAQAVRYVPQNEKAWFNASIAETLLAAKPPRAAELLERANALTALRPTNMSSVRPHAWGYYYTTEALATKESVLFEPYATRALHYLDRTIAESRRALKELEPVSSGIEETCRDIFLALLRKSLIFGAAGNQAAAEQAIQEAYAVPLEEVPIEKSEVWRLLKRASGSKSH